MNAWRQTHYNKLLGGSRAATRSRRAVAKASAEAALRTHGDQMQALGLLRGSSVKQRALGNVLSQIEAFRDGTPLTRSPPSPYYRSLSLLVAPNGLGATPADGSRTSIRHSVAEFQINVPSSNPNDGVRITCYDLSERISGARSMTPEVFENLNMRWALQLDYMRVSQAEDEQMDYSCGGAVLHGVSSRQRVVQMMLYQHALAKEVALAWKPSELLGPAGHDSAEAGRNAQMARFRDHLLKLPVPSTMQASGWESGLGSDAKAGSNCLQSTRRTPALWCPSQARPPGRAATVVIVMDSAKPFPLQERVQVQQPGHVTVNTSGLARAGDLYCTDIVQLYEKYETYAVSVASKCVGTDCKQTWLAVIEKEYPGLGALHEFTWLCLQRDFRGSAEGLTAGEFGARMTSQEVAARLLMQLSRNMLGMAQDSGSEGKLRYNTRQFYSKAANPHRELMRVSSDGEIHFGFRWRLLSQRIRGQFLYAFGRTGGVEAKLHINLSQRAWPPSLPLPALAVWAQYPPALPQLEPLPWAPALSLTHSRAASL